MAHSENIPHGDPVHNFFGGGRAADLFLWRKKKVSAAVLGAATLTWYYVEFLGLPFIMFACTFSIITFSILFAVATGAISLLIPIPREPIPIPEVYLPKELFLEAALAIHTEIYRALVLAREVAVKGAYRRYLMIVSVLFFGEILGVCASLLTLSYTLIVLLLVVPVLFKNALLLYERYGCNICTYAQKSMAETKEDCATFVAQVALAFGICAFSTHSYFMPSIFRRNGMILMRSPARKCSNPRRCSIIWKDHDSDGA